MNHRRTFLILAILSLCLIITISAVFGAASLGWLALLPRTQPSPMSQNLFPGIEYSREIQDSPPLVIHILRVDLRSEGIQLLVTPGDAQAERSLKARTTSEFLKDFRLQVAVNGDGFTPWYSNNPLDYYPRTGDPVEPVGYAASKGVVYAENPEEQPVLYLSRTNQARFGTPVGRIYNAISGNQMLVQDGKVNPGLDGEKQPRTAIGIDKRGRQLIIIVVDGRQPGYSVGVNLTELAEILVKHGVQTGMNLDGGGSSTLVAEEHGRPVILNSPINNGIPGQERPVGNHLGIFAGGEN